MSEDELERRLLRLWRTVLDKPDLPESASFFRHGGDSLSAIRLVAMLRDELDRPALSVRTVFEAPSVAQYAALLARL